MPNASFLKSSSGGEPLTFNRYPLNITHIIGGFFISHCSEPDTELRFDLASASLKTLPVATKEEQLQTRVQDSKMNTDLVEEAAKYLKELLGLTIFGFDVVVSVLWPVVVHYSYKPLWFLVLYLESLKLDI